jgi:hypothetical protein
VRLTSLSRLLGTHHVCWDACCSVCSAWGRGGDLPSEYLRRLGSHAPRPAFLLWCADVTVRQLASARRWWRRQWYVCLLPAPTTASPPSRLRVVCFHLRGSLSGRWPFCVELGCALQSASWRCVVCNSCVCVCVCVCVASSACGSRRTSVQLNGRWFCSFACVRLVLLPSDVLPALERSASIARRPARGRRLVTWPLLLVLRQLLPTSRPRHAGNAGNNCPCLAGLSGAVARLRIAGKLVVCIARRSPANRQDVAAACITMALGACC